MRIVSLHTYPLKGARAVDLTRAHFMPLGIDGDRRWLVVDENDRYVTQRENHLLATIIVQPATNGLRLSAEGAEDLVVETPDGHARRNIVLFRSNVDVAVADARAHAWLSERLRAPAKLVYMDAHARREKRETWRPDAVPISFSDNYPVLVTTTGSLAALNAEIARSGAQPVPMTRFRPNVVVDCADAWREDVWKRARLGDVELEFVRPCDRCQVPQKDQITGELMGDEPTVALGRIRRSADERLGGRVLFGAYALVRVAGHASPGVPFEVVEEHAPFALFPPQRVAS